MKLKKNVGDLDALMRITIGLTGLAVSTARMVDRPYRTGPMITAALSAMKVGEGVTRFCPVLYLMGTNTLNPGNRRKTPYRIRRYPRTQYGRDS